MKTIAILIGALIVAALIWRRLRQDECPPDDAGEAAQITDATARIRATRAKIDEAVDANPIPADGESPGPKQK